jgi:hypothetical protein
MSIYFESQQGEFEIDSERVSDVLGFSEEDIEVGGNTQYASLGKYLSV